MVADEEADGHPAHVLRPDHGGRPGRDDPGRGSAGADTAALLQRTGLNLAGGRVVFGFGGNNGDCATYRGGWCPSRKPAGHPTCSRWTGSPASRRARSGWGGAPAVDATGHVWVSVGNGSVSNASRGYDDSDSVLDLTPSMRLLQYFAPASWAADNAHDLDLSAEPALLPGGQVLIAGKSAIPYLLDGAHLGGIGGQLAAAAPACGANIDGGTAVSGRTVYLPCVGGIVAVRVTASPPGVRLRWNSRTGGGPPIVAGAWSDDQPGRVAVRPQCGDRAGPAAGPDRHRGEPLPHPERRAGLLLAPAGNRVVAFRMGHSAASPASPAPSGTGPADKPVGAGHRASGHVQHRAAGGLSGGEVAGIVAGTLVVLGGIGWLVWRRVPNRP